MSGRIDTAGAVGSARFRRLGVPATLTHVAQLRFEFSDWLHRSFTLAPHKSSDIVLAVHEALANAAEFAYITRAQHGVMHLRADYKEPETLTVTVADEGRWRIRDPATEQDPARGRGIHLMRALADRAAVESAPAGTQVRLQWGNIQPAPQERSSTPKPSGSPGLIDLPIRTFE
ncbi:ATP-binding protein [Mycobacterium sp. NPDC050441]|uniref:ATP-binding protein n=1 Tax=Mycobacterium sp. NPDC050441 TaxID=3155403 RepID=UPI0033D8288A